MHQTHNHFMIRKPVDFPKVYPASKIIIDLDTGCDDAQAVLLLLHLAKKYKKQILGICCVDGNTSLDDVVTNTLICLNVAGAKVPIYKGAHQGLMGVKDKDGYFGTDGFNNKQAEYKKILTEEDWKLVQQKSAYRFILDSIHTYGQDLSLICLAPLTNLATAFYICPDIVHKLGNLSIMGGAVSGVGLNEAFSSEFNFHMDPLAAYIVIKNFKNINLITLEYAFDLDVSKEHEQSIFFKEHTPKAKLIKDLFENKHPLICDPLTIFPGVVPEFAEKMYYVYAELELGGARTEGYLAIEWLHKPKDAPNHPNLRIIAEMNHDRMILQLIQSLEIDDYSTITHPVEPSTADSTKVRSRRSSGHHHHESSYNGQDSVKSIGHEAKNTDKSDNNSELDNSDRTSKNSNETHSQGHPAHLVNVHPSYANHTKSPVMTVSDAAPAHSPKHTVVTPHNDQHHNDQRHKQTKSPH